MFFLIFFLFAGLFVISSGNRPPSNEGYYNTELSTAERVRLIMADMGHTDKALQLVQIERQAAFENIGNIAGLGSVLSGGGSTPPGNIVDGWRKWISSVQNGIMKRGFQIPAIYGIDAVHGHANVVNTTIFPQNIGLGTADNPLMAVTGPAPPVPARDGTGRGRLVLFPCLKKPGDLCLLRKAGIVVYFSAYR